MESKWFSRTETFKIATKFLMRLSSSAVSIEICDHHSKFVSIPCLMYESVSMCIGPASYVPWHHFFSFCLTCSQFFQSWLAAADYILHTVMWRRTLNLDRTTSLVVPVSSLCIASVDTSTFRTRFFMTSCLSVRVTQLYKSKYKI